MTINTKVNSALVGFIKDHPRAQITQTTRVLQMYIRKHKFW